LIVLVDDKSFAGGAQDFGATARDLAVFAYKRYKHREDLDSVTVVLTSSAAAISTVAKSYPFGSAGLR
jgi:hypothetical protein